MIIAPKFAIDSLCRISSPVTPSPGEKAAPGGFGTVKPAGRSRIVGDRGVGSASRSPDGDGDTESSTAGSRVVRIGVTGHMDLTSSSLRLVAQALQAHLNALVRAGRRRIVGVSCLAPGADRVFAQVLLELGGQLEAIIPPGDYTDHPGSAGDGECPTLEELVGRAMSVRRMTRPLARPQAYVAANDAMLATIDSLVAVWNGERSEKLGGTAHVVQTARSRSIPVTVIWPTGAERRG